MLDSLGRFACRADAGGRLVPIFVLRGDLYSDTGYARATRALRCILADHARQVFGVSLHEHEKRRKNPLDFPVISDAELCQNPLFQEAVVLNVCLPDDFVRVAGAFNIGYFFWETEAMPSFRFWKAQMTAMDRIWAPSRWQSEFLREATGRPEIPVIPWPLEMEGPPTCMDEDSLSQIRAHAAMTSAELDNYLVRSAPEGTRAREKDLEAMDHAAGRSARFDPGRSPTFGALDEGAGDLFVAVQTDAARKGMPLLLASWMQFKSSPAGRDAKLVVKMSPLDVGADLYRTHFHASLAVQRAARRCRVDRPDIWFVHDRLGHGEMRALLRAADALVTATMGEGFGGPIAEALMEGTPVIAPRHTSIRDLLNEGYPLIVESEPHVLKLWNNIDVYSASSRWHIVDDTSFVDCLERFARLSKSARRVVAEDARDALLAHAGGLAVSQTVGVELERCLAIQRARSVSAHNSTRPRQAYAAAELDQV